MVYRVMFSDGLNYAKEGRLKKGGKKIAPVTRGAKGTQTTTKTFTLSRSRTDTFCRRI